MPSIGNTKEIIERLLSSKSTIQRRKKKRKDKGNKLKEERFWGEFNMPEKTWEQEVAEAAARGEALIKAKRLIHMDAPCDICNIDYPSNLLISIDQDDNSWIYKCRSCINKHDLIETTKIMQNALPNYSYYGIIDVNVIKIVAAFCIGIHLYY